MNHKPKQTPSSNIAGLWFANYVKAKVIDAGQSEKLAKAIGMERKQIYKYASGEASPKLEVIANILAYFGDFDKVREAIGGLDILKESEEVPQLPVQEEPGMFLHCRPVQSKSIRWED